MNRTPDISRRSFLLRGAGLAAAVAGGNALAGCASSATSGSGSGSGSDVTLTVMSSEIKPEELEPFHAANPKIKITLVPADNTRLNAMLAAGNPPDVVRGLGALQTPYLAARKIAAKLDDYVAKSTLLPASDLDPVNDVWRFDGKKQGAGPRYGIAKDYSQDQMFWFNSKVFDDAKVALPSLTEPLSYEAWLDLGRRLTRKAGSQTDVFGLDPSPSNHFAHLIGMTQAAGGRIFSEDLTKVDFSSPEARRVLQFYVDFVKADIGPSLVKPPPAGGSGPLYKANRLAMISAGYWYGGGLVSDPVGETSRLAPAPQYGGVRVSPCYSATGYWIAEKSQHKDDAWRFLEWYLGGDPAKTRAGSGWGIPTRKSLRPSLPTAKPFQQEALKTQTAELSHFSTLTFSPYAKVDAIDAILTQQLPATINAGAAVGAIADTLNNQINELLKQGLQLTN